MKYKGNLFSFGYFFPVADFACGISFGIVQFFLIEGGVFSILQVVENLMISCAWNALPFVIIDVELWFPGQIGCLEFEH